MIPHSLLPQPGLPLSLALRFLSRCSAVPEWRRALSVLLLSRLSLSSTTDRVVADNVGSSLELIFRQLLVTSKTEEACHTNVCGNDRQNRKHYSTDTMTDVPRNIHIYYIYSWATAVLFMWGSLQLAPIILMSTWGRVCSEELYKSPTRRTCQLIERTLTRSCHPRVLFLQDSSNHKCTHVRMTVFWPVNVSFHCGIVRESVAFLAFFITNTYDR